MKKIINALYEALLDWSTILAEYRQSKASKYHY
jgi:hypothetical protein